MTLHCPRDPEQVLETVHEHGIEVDRCPRCRGAWYEYSELAALESTVAGKDYMIGTIEYATRESELVCPAGGEPMVAFNYRAYNLELDACPGEHGFWLDAGESDRVRDIMRERERGMRRAGSAQKAWARAKGRPASGGVLDQLRDLFRRR
jgi:Zn-finger nucleic acid-binding protein